MPRERLGRVFCCALGCAWLTSGCGSTGDGASDEAETKSSLCGPARPICELDRCGRGTCSMVEIGRVPAAVTALAVDTTHVYAIAENGGALYSIPKCGGTAEVLVRTTTLLQGLVAFRDWVYWYDGDVYKGTLNRVPKEGGPSEQVLPASGEPVAACHSVTADDDAVYLAGSASIGLRRFDDAGEHVFSEYGTGAPLLVDETSLHYDGSGVVLSVDKVLGTRTGSRIMPSGVRLATHDVNAFYLAGYTNGVYRAIRLPKTNGDAQEHATFRSNPTLLADERCLYASDTAFVDGKQHTLSVRFPVTGGEPELLLEGDALFIFALDADSMFIASRTGSVYRRPK